MPAEVSGGWRDRLAAMISSSPVNLVSRADRQDVRRIHIDECVAIAQVLEVEEGARWMDLGTGGGLPGLVLAAAFPWSAWTLLDARAKKIAQVAAFADVLGLKNVTAIHGRAEELSDDPEHRGRYDGVISRAVGALDVTVALSRGFVEYGEIVAIRGPRGPEEADALVRWCDDLGVTLETVSPIGGTMRPTWLIRLRGRGPVPARFPRARRKLLHSARGGGQGDSCD